jgi:DNA-binding NarL/FixJ family response regulator
MIDFVKESDTYIRHQFLPHGINEALFLFSMRHDLTQREREVMTLIAGFGLANREIAEQLAISEKTVKNHISNMMTKLGIRSMRKLLPLLIHEALRSGRACRMESWNEEGVACSNRVPGLDTF